MESSDTTITTITTSSSSRSVSPSSSHSHCPPPPAVVTPVAAAAVAPPPVVVISPCAACKILRRRCAEKCVLAPYFPPSDPIKFTTAHRVFGASNIIKFLQELPENQRADAVSSMVYEANARLRDPVYGCAGAICQLQKQVNELQGQLAKAQAELVTMQCQQANLMAIICMEMSQSNNQQQQQQMSSMPMPMSAVDNSNYFFDPYYDNISISGTGTGGGGVVAGGVGSLWEPLWT